MESENKKAAACLLGQIIRLDLTKVSIPNDVGRADDYNLCFINGDKYVRKRDLRCNSDNFVNSQIKKGVIKPADLLHVVADGSYGSRCVVLLRTSPLIRLKDEMFSHERKCRFTNMTSVEHLFEAIEGTAALHQYTIPQAELERSESCFEKRQSLLMQDRQDRYEAEKEQRRMEKEYEERPTLQDLVAKIEAMGWDVTLKLRHQQ